jgi:hypothetical protein
MTGFTVFWAVLLALVVNDWRRDLHKRNRRDIIKHERDAAEELHSLNERNRLGDTEGAQHYAHMYKSHAKMVKWMKVFDWLMP